MKLIWAGGAWEDYVHWQSNDSEMVAKINVLLKEIRRTPFHGTGKPEPLRGKLQGWWSRRIVGEHRLVYRIRGSGEEQAAEILACRYHYS
jgi:toxin YoeB